jgi:transposase InsO family protein
MLQIHPCARTTPAVRAEIARSREPTGVLARRYGVSTETIRKWRKRGPEDCRDHSARPRTLPWRATEEERAIVCEVRRATRFALDDLTFALRHFLPHLNRHSIWRILRAEGLHRLSDLPPLYPGQRPKKGQGKFRDYDLGFVHIDIKQLPKLHVGGREFRRRHLYVAIEPRGIGGSASDRRSRSVHLAVKEDMTAPSATAFLREAAAAFPFRLTHVLTDRGPCFTTGAFAKACAALGAQHRTTRPYTPQTNGMAERFNGRVEREVLTITVGSHRDLERLLKGYNQAYNARPQRVLKGKSPDEVVRGRLAEAPDLANPRHKPPDPTSPPIPLSWPRPCAPSQPPRRSRDLTSSPRFPSAK